MFKYSNSELIMAYELINAMSDFADDIGAAEDFKKIAFGMPKPKKIITSQSWLSVLGKAIGPFLGGGSAAGGAGGMIGGALNLAPAALYSLLLAGPLAGEQIWNAIKRKTGKDPEAGSPWFLKQKTMFDPSWDEPSGVARMKEMPGYTQFPDMRTDPSWDRASEMEMESLRNQMGLPRSMGGTSGPPTSEQISEILNNRAPYQPSSSPLSSIDALRMNANKRKGRFVSAQSASFQQSMPNAPQHPFSGLIFPTSPEAFASTFAGTDIYNPIDMQSPRFLPQGGEGYAPKGVTKWLPGGNPLETAMNRQRAFTETQSEARLDAFMADAYNNIMIKAQSGMIDPMTASNILRTLPLQLIQMGHPSESVWRAHSQAMSNLESGRSGYNQRMIGRFNQLPAANPSQIEGIDSPNRRRIMDYLSGAQTRMQNIGDITGVDPTKGLLPQKYIQTNPFEQI